MNSTSGFYKINNAGDRWYRDFEKIYSVSFPVYELRSDKQQEYAFRDSRYNLFCILDEKKDMLCAFISFWEFERYIYIEHLAVNQELRGKNLGSKMLKDFNSETSKTIILEIDPIKDEIAERRLRFYQKLGYVLNPYKHYHPAYNTEYPPHELLVLNTGEQLPPDLYETFKNDLENIIMKKV